MNKILVVLAAAFLLSSCEDHDDSKSKPKLVRFKSLPVELADCRTYVVTTDYNTTMVITRCPMSTTNTLYGKYGNTTTVDESPSSDTEGEVDDRPKEKADEK
jgi:hypothetical protein